MLRCAVLFFMHKLRDFVALFVDWNSHSVCLVAIFWGRVKEIFAETGESECEENTLTWWVSQTRVDGGGGQKVKHTAKIRAIWNSAKQNMYIRWIYLCKHRAVYGKSLHLIFSAATAAAEKRKPRTEQMHQQTNDVSETRFILLSYMPWTSSLLISAHISVAAIFSRTHFIIACLLILQLWLKEDKNNSIWFASANSFKPKIHLVWLLHYMGLSLGLVSCFVFDFTYFAVLLFLLLPFLPFRSFVCFRLPYHLFMDSCALCY